MSVKTIDSKKQVAINILKQLGGRRFLAFTGARNLVSTENSMTCQIPKMGWMTITLNGMDTYDITFKKLKRTKNKEQSKAFGFTIWDEEIVVWKEYSNIYNDQLVEIFEETTGLFTTL